MAAIQKAPEVAPPAKNGSNGVKPAVAGSQEGLTAPKPEHFIRVTKVSRKVKDLICRFDDYDEPFVKGVTLHSYLQYIADERLRSMPRRGSDWDRVLSTAQFFGLQMWYFAIKIDAFATECLESASAALAGCQVLLEIGHAQAKALVPTFTALYELAMMLSNVGQIHDLVRMPRHIRETTVAIFCDLVDLAGTIASHYRERIQGLQPGSSVSISFDAAFGAHIDRVWTSRNALCDSVWAFKLTRGGSLRWLREKLVPSFGPSVRGSLYDEVLEQLDRSEDTCTWIKDNLVQFFDGSEQVLNVSAPAGFGKTVLAEWVEERLARPLDNRSYVVLSYKFPYDSANQATTLACLKSLLFQLLERSVGDVALYTSLVQAFDEDAASHDAKKLQATLWRILHDSLKSAEHDGDHRSFVILTDGCDDTCGSAAQAVAFHKELGAGVAKLQHTRVINFSRPAAHLAEKSRQLVMTAKHVHADIKAHFGQTLARSSHWDQFNVVTQEEIVENLAARSQGSFLWAYFVGRVLVREPASHDAFVKTLQGLPNDVPKLLGLVVDGLGLAKDETLRLLLSFMLVTAEPFAVHEIAELLSTDLHKHALAPTPLNVAKFVSERCGHVVVIRGGRLHFRSALVRTHMQSLLGKSLLSAKDAHLQLTQRMLLYARLSLGSEQDISTEELEYGSLDHVLNSHRFLGYVMRNWIVHFRLAGLVEKGGEVKVNKDFAAVLPESIMFVLLERSCWHRNHGGQEQAELHELALKIREACFGKEHLTVLQTLINLGHVHVKLEASPVHGANYFYRAVKLGQVLLSRTSHAVAACTALFLHWTETIVVTKRNEIITRREEMIRLMIEICKHKHGRTSDEVIVWYETLAKFYLDIKEEWQVTVVYKELYEIIVAREGKGSARARKIGEFFGNLDIVFEVKDGSDQIGELEELIFETSEDMDVTDHTCILMLLKLAQSYLSCGKFYLAERLYVSLWRRICVIGRLKPSHEVHVSKIEIALAYVQFLREVKRVEEATSILVCLWNEYEHHKCEDETLVIWIRKVGSVCREMKLLDMTVSILRKVWGWFKEHGKVEHDEAQQTTLLITEVVEEIVETTVTEKATTVTEVEVTETVVKDIYELHVARCKKTKVDKALFSACNALFALYTSRGNHKDAEVVITRTLQVTWKAFLSSEATISVAEHHVGECILVARRLANCHLRQGSFELAEKTHLRIYRACLSSCRLDDECLQQSIAVLVGFYEEHHRHEKVIDVYVEVLRRYREDLAHGHDLTIKTLYLLAAHCELIGHKDAAYVHYLEVVTILNKDQKHCHRDALKASLWLFRHYHALEKWTEFRDVCVVLWETVVKHHKESGITEEVIVEIYQKYTHVLEVHFKVQFSVLYEICTQYKQTVTVIGGSDSPAVILALVALAELCEKREENHHEGVTVYEEVIKKITTTKTTTTTIKETTVHMVKKRLAKLYVTIVTTGKGKTPLAIDRAIEVCVQTYEHLKIEKGCWHESTLAALRDVVVLYQKVATKESHLRIVQLLQLSVTEIVTTLSVTVNLFSAAVTLASIYTAANLAKEGHELLRQLRHLIVFHGTMPGQDISLKLDVAVSKVVFVFLIAFEHRLHGTESAISYTEFMADIIFESLLYEEYSRVVESPDAKLEVVLECGAKLRVFWEEHQRTHLLAALDQRLFGLFKKHYGNLVRSTSDDHSRIFYLAILAELARDRSTTAVDFAALACKAGNDKIKALLAETDFYCAQHVGHCVFRWAAGQKLYQRRSCIRYGYKLAELLAGIDVPHPTDPKQQDIRHAMLDTSRDVMAEVLEAFRAADMDVLALRFEDVAGLIRLLGAQANYVELEKLLWRLWRTREVVQKARGWSPELVLEMGKLLVHAQHAQGHVAQAINTADLLFYNLRRGRGAFDRDTLEVSRLLASLYASANIPAKAMVVHEEVLREISSACHAHAQNEKRVASYIDLPQLALEATRHLNLLRAAHHQLQGWTRSAHEISELYYRLRTGLKLDVPEFNQWASSRGEKGAPDGRYAAPLEWKLEGEAKDSLLWKRVENGEKGVKENVIHAARGWWLVY